MSEFIHHGDCIEIMRGMDAQSVDFILTHPPYLVRYRDRSGRSLKGDSDPAWLEPAFAQMHRVLANDAFCVSFYGWNCADLFIAAWKKAGFRIAGHLVFRKRYASSSRFLSYTHEQAYLLAKGSPPLPANPPRDVMELPYSGNRLHPTQKPVAPLCTLINAFAPEGGIVLDPFCGSGSTLLAARRCGRHFIGIELDPAHHETASQRLFEKLAA